jgi:hypothetical protein
MGLSITAVLWGSHYACYGKVGCCCRGGSFCSCTLVRRMLSDHGPQLG